MPDHDQWVVVGLDNGGTTNNATVLDSEGRFLVDEMSECPSCVREGPDKAIDALERSLDLVLDLTGIPRTMVRAVGLDTPGPVSADGVISASGATNFKNPAWCGFDVRGALESRLGIRVLYNNDANAAALYAHHAYFGPEAPQRSSISAIVGTGLGGGVVEAGQVVHGAAGMAGELGHVWIPMDGLLADGQPPPACNCGLSGDAESVASLTGIEKNLLPYWLARHPDHPLAQVNHAEAAKLVRGYGEAGDPLALRIFAQQAMAIGRLFTIAANFTDPDAYFVGGGVVEAAPHFRDWFLDRVREHTILRAEQGKAATVALVPDLDMAGARGSAIAASAAVVGLSSRCPGHSRAARVWAASGWADSLGCWHAAEVPGTATQPDGEQMNEDRARAMLLEERADVQKLLGAAEEAAQEDRSAEDEVGDSADPAQALTAEGTDTAIAETMRDRLGAIDRALKRLDDGTYGRSVRSGVAIPDERLEADPAAELTVEEASS